MADFQSKISSVNNLLNNAKALVEKGNTDAVNLRTIANKISGLKRTSDRFNATELAALNKILNEYEQLKNLTHQKVQKAQENLVKKVVTVKKATINNIKSLEDAVKDIPDVSDIPNVDGVVARTIKGTKKEQQDILLLMKRYDSVRERILQVNKKRIDAGKKELDYADYLQKQLFKDLQSRGHVKKSNNDILKVNKGMVADFYTYLSDNLHSLSSSDTLYRNFLYTKNISNLQAPFRKIKTNADEQVGVPIGSSNVVTPYNPGAASRYMTKKTAGVRNVFDIFEHNFRKLGGHRDQFEDLVLNTVNANSALTKASATESINSSIGALWATIESLVKSENLPEHFQKIFGTYSYNKNGQKGKRKPKIYQFFDDTKKALAYLPKYTKINDSEYQDKSGNIYKAKDLSELAHAIDTNGKTISPEALSTYSAILSNFGSIGDDNNTGKFIKTWSQLVSNKGVELTPGAFNTLYNVDSKGKVVPITDADIDMLSPKARKKMGQNIIPKEGTHTEPQKSMGSALDASKTSTTQLLLAIHGVSRRIDELIGLVSPNPKVLATVKGQFGSPLPVDSDEEIEEGKSAYQTNQDNISKDRARQKSFIGLLIPELAKLLNKHPVWDAIKLLLFKFGQHHPKLAATALLGGPALLTGAVALGSKLFMKSLLGIPTSKPVVKSSSTNILGAISNSEVMSNASKNYTKYQHNSKRLKVLEGNINSTQASLTRMKNSQVDKYFPDVYKRKEARLGKLQKIYEARQAGTVTGRSTTFLNNLNKTFVEGIKSFTSPANWTKGAKGYSGVLRMPFQLLGRGTAGLAGGAASLGKGALSLAKGAGPEALIATVIVGAIVGAAKPIMQGVLEPLKVIIEPTKKALTSMGDAFKGIWTGVVGILHPIIALGDILFDFGKTIGSVLGNFLKPFIKILMGPLAIAWNLCINAARIVGSTVGALGTAIGVAGQVLGDALYFMWGAIKIVGEKIAKSPIGRAISRVWNGFSQGVQNIIDTVGNFFTSLTDKVVGWIKGCTEGMAKVWDNFKAAHPRIAEIIEKGKGNDKKDSDKTNGSATSPNNAGKDGKQSSTSGSSVGSNTVFNGNNKKFVNGERASEAYRKHYKSIGGHAITSGFGYRGNVGAGASTVHNGVDLQYSYGESVGAKHAGTVVVAGKQRGYGNVVYVQEANGNIQRYGHLSAINVSKGQKINVGTVLGKAGSSGTSYGTHLHYEVRDKRGRALDPAAYELGHQVASSMTKVSSAVGVDSVATGTTNDDVRAGLMNLAMSTNARNKRESVEKMVWDPTDVTGSLGCWGIVQLNSTGQMVH